MNRNQDRCRVRLFSYIVESLSIPIRTSWSHMRLIFIMEILILQWGPRTCVSGDDLHLNHPNPEMFNIIAETYSPKFPHHASGQRWACVYLTWDKTHQPSHVPLHGLLITVVSCPFMFSYISHFFRLLSFLSNNFTRKYIYILRTFHSNIP